MSHYIYTRKLLIHRKQYLSQCHGDIRVDKDIILKAGEVRKVKRVVGVI